MDPRQYRPGASVRLDASFLDADGDLDSPDEITLTIRPPGDAVDAVRTWPVPGTGIVEASEGVFYADVVASAEGWWQYGWASDAPTAAFEGMFQVLSALTASPLSILQQVEDYEGIRQLLAVTDVDVPDDVIESIVFAQQAELEVKARIEGWQEILDDDDDTAKMRLRFAAAYWTASLIAAQWAQGGMIGLAHDGRLEDRDWQAEAARLRGYAEKWVVQLEQAEEDSGVIYSLPMVIASGPTRRGRRAPGAPRLVQPGWSYGFPVVWGGWVSNSGD